MTEIIQFNGIVIIATLLFIFRLVKLAMEQRHERQMAEVQSND